MHWPDLKWSIAKLLQSYLTLCDPIDGSPSGSPIPGILQARTLEWVAISFSMHESKKWNWSRSVVSDSLWPHGLKPTRLLHPWDFSRQEFWSGVPLPSLVLMSSMFKVIIHYVALTSKKADAQEMTHTHSELWLWYMLMRHTHSELCMSFLLHLPS